MANSDCKKILNLIPLYVDKMLSEEETDIVSRHLEICEDCKKELDFMKSMQKTAAALPDIEPSCCDFHKNLMEKAQRKQRAKKARKFIILRRAGAGAAAAAVVALCLVNFANIDNTRISTTPDQYATPATDISQNPVSLTAPTPEDLSAPKNSTAVPKPETAHTDSAHTEAAPTALEEPNAPSGGGSAKSPDYADEAQIPSMLSVDEAYTVATVTVTDENRDAIIEILSSYEQDEKGYKVSDINAVLRQLAELGATVEAVCDSTVTANYITIK